MTFGHLSDVCLVRLSQSEHPATNVDTAGVSDKLALYAASFRSCLTAFHDVVVTTLSPS